MFRINKKQQIQSKSHKHHLVLTTFHFFLPVVISKLSQFSCYKHVLLSLIVLVCVLFPYFFVAFAFWRLLAFFIYFYQKIYVSIYLDKLSCQRQLFSLRYLQKQSFA